MCVIKKFNIFHKFLTFLIFVPVYIIRKTLEIPRAYRSFLAQAEIDYTITQILFDIRKKCASEDEYNFVVDHIEKELKNGVGVAKAISSGHNLIKLRCEFRDSKAVK